MRYAPNAFARASHTILKRINKLDAELQTTKDLNEKYEAENTQQKEALTANRRIMKHNKTLQSQNRALENALETAKSEYGKAKDAFKDLQRSFAKVKMERDELNGLLKQFISCC